ncbi:MAG: AMP-binding protein [Thermoleophilia bacterium]|nr:AMP-binding protein [Thermoleophilia bacterium]
MAEWSDWYRREDPTGWVLPRILRERAEAHPERPYYRFGGGEWISYGEMSSRTNRVANAMRRRGQGPGDVVSTLLFNMEPHLEIWFGIQAAGATQCPINTAYRGDFLSWAINLPRARMLVVGSEHLHDLDQIVDELPLLEHVVVVHGTHRDGPDPRRSWETYEEFLDGVDDRDPGVDVSWTDDARVMFTSGTTGRSKGVIKQQASDYFSGRTYCLVTELTEDDTVYSCLPLFHSNAQVLATYPAMIAGARVQFQPRYSSTNFWPTVNECGATVLNTVSAINYFIWNTPPSALDHSHSVTRIMAMPAPKDIYHEFQERFGIRFVEGYGLTETGMVTYHPPDRPARAGSCGIATPGFEVSVVEPGTDRPLPPGTQGEIVVDMKIPNIVMRAYIGMPEKTAEDFRNLKLHTGDLGELDEEGYLYFRDRLKDYIRRRGENVSSVEVETSVTSHPNVLEAAAVGVKAGEGAGAEDEILVCVVPREGHLDAGELCEYLTERMPAFAVPRYVRVMDHLPKTPTERVRKVELREEGVTADTYDRMVHR